MANANHEDTIAEIAGNQQLYDAVDLSKLSLEQSIRLIQLHKMRKTHDEMVHLGSELKNRHKNVQELHKLMQLINVVTTRETGDNRNKLTLTHPNLGAPNIEIAHDLTKLLKSKQSHSIVEGKKSPKIDLSHPDAAPIRAKLEAAKELGLTVELKDIYDGQEVTQLFAEIRNLTGVSNDETWTAVQNIKELREKLTKAKEEYQIEFKWPVDEFSSEERDTLMSAIEGTVKDFNLQNDMQMQELNRGYQERLEILQMARSLVKALHDDKLHKARSSSGR